MPKTTAEGMTQISVRFPTPLAAALRDRAEREEVSLNDLIRTPVEDQQTFFGLPKRMSDQLDADATAMGLDRREYLMHLLALRYEQVIRGGPGSETEKHPAPKPSR